MIDKKKIKCPLCSGGLGTFEIDGWKTDMSHIDCHCTNCDIWFEMTEVTDEEKLEMFDW